jgi:hypothetical protein
MTDRRPTLALTELNELMRKKYPNLECWKRFKLPARAIDDNVTSSERKHLLEDTTNDHEHRASQDEHRNRL